MIHRKKAKKAETIFSKYPLGEHFLCYNIDSRQERRGLDAGHNRP